MLRQPEVPLLASNLLTWPSSAVDMATRLFYSHLGLTVVLAVARIFTKLIIQ